VGFVSIQTSLRSPQFGETGTAAVSNGNSNGESHDGWLANISKNLFTICLNKARARLCVKYDGQPLL